jgi:Pyruvate/2-oxoacid:ferredoxin oxidoreductase gamma subunit
VDRQLIMTGIGGQGVQLAAAVVARAALLEGRDVQVFGSYGGMMRGGATESTVVISDGSVESPPTVASTWSAVLMHHEHAAPVLVRLEPHGVLFVNTSVVDRPEVARGCTVIEVPANDIALTLGSAMAASMVMVGAYAAATGLVGLASLSAASRASLPSYRTQHAALNDEALRAGFGTVALTVPAWPQPVVTA